VKESRTHSESSHRSSEVRRSVFSLESGSLHRRVPASRTNERFSSSSHQTKEGKKERRKDSHVSPNELHRTPRDSSSLVRDLERDVLLSLNNYDLDGRELLSVCSAVVVDGGSEGVLEEFEDDVGAEVGERGRKVSLGRRVREEVKPRSKRRRRKQTHRCPGT